MTGSRTIRGLRFGLIGTRPIYILFRIVWFARRRKLAKIAARIKDEYGRTVVGGPFSGMAYPPSAPDAAYVQRLVGCYEAELHDVIERVVAHGYRRIVNIGAGEGYYAVGLARRVPDASVIAFELDAGARRLCAETAADNDVTDRVSVSGGCTPSTLRGVLEPHALVVCDCEGGEVELLDPDVVPALRTCDILVELHDFIDPTITDTVVGRFRNSHDVEMVEIRERDSSRFEALSVLDGDDRETALYEARPRGQHWAFMTAQAQAPSASS